MLLQIGALIDRFLRDARACCSASWSVSRLYAVRGGLSPARLFETTTRIQVTNGIQTMTDWGDYFLAIVKTLHPEYEMFRHIGWE